MLHRLKLRLLYGEALKKDKSARKRKMRTILLAGLYTYPPFSAIAYFIASETRVVAILLIGLFSAITCIPVVFYAYAKGFGAPFFTLFRERREEFFWLAVKVGFIYPFFLYFMILGFVEFFMGYGAVRAAMVSFVAVAVARDGFEIGFFRARFQNQTIHTFPDGKQIRFYLSSPPACPPACPLARLVVVFICFSSGAGFFLGHYFTAPSHQTVIVGVVTGIMATIIYAQTVHSPSFRMLAQFLIWPGFTMAVTYFLGLAYLAKMMLKMPLSPAVELALLMGLSSAWLILETQFIGYLKGKGESVN